ncbi:MAG: hypothetical protein HFI74_11960, partial [Lachnospiraceae bacterium]|nr:hypothetical protein [Lachnospiraceae bacterium]
VLGLFLAGCAGNPEVTSDAGAVEKEEVVDSKEGDVLQEQEVQEEKENSKESDISQEQEVQEEKENSQESDISQETYDQGEDQDISDEASEDDVLAAIQSLKDDTFTDAQLQEIYTSIKESVKSEYLDRNGIDPQYFTWPKAFGTDGIDEDNAWLYLDHIITNYLSEEEEQYSIEEAMEELPSEQNQQLMNAVLAGIIEWIQLNKNFTVSQVILCLAPMGEKIPDNIDFTD